MRYILFILPFLLILTACLEDDFEDPNTQFILTAKFGTEIDRLEFEDNNLRILNIKYVADNLEVETTDENDRFESDSRFVNLSTLAVGGETVVGSGILVGGSYTGISYNLQQASIDNPLNDPGMYELDENDNIVGSYSYVINGLYNNEIFSIRSKYTGRVAYSFDRNVNMPEKLGTLQVDLIPEWEEWFLNENRDGILDPNVLENQDIIRERFRTFFTADVFTIGEE